MCHVKQQMWWCSGVPCFEPIEKRLKVKEREICISINWLDALIFQASRHEEAKSKPEGVGDDAPIWVNYYTTDTT